MQSVRAWQCTDSIDKLKKMYLSHPYIRYFIHDITYGKGQFSILANNRVYLKNFYESQCPAFFTDESGRFLPEGVYLTHMLPLTNDESLIINTLSDTFSFNYLIHIVKYAKNLHHTYTFMLYCTEQQLLVFIANNLPQLHRFVALYNRKCKECIEYVKAEKDHLVLPYSSDKKEEMLSLLQSCLLNEDPNTDRNLYIPHAFDNQMIKLTQQQARCFYLLLQGRTAKDIANEMNLSYRTIQHYTVSIYERLGLESSREMISHYVYLLK